MISIMEAPAMLENGNAAKNGRSRDLPVAFYALIFVLIIISALFPIVFCLLHHRQAQGPCWAHGSFKEPATDRSAEMSWNWTLKHCDGIVEEQGQYLIIQQSGKYFSYAQLYRLQKAEEPFTLMCYKHPGLVLSNIVGHENGTVNFARPFLLEKGDMLYCKKNDNLDILLSNQTYWGLFKM